MILIKHKLAAATAVAAAFSLVAAPAAAVELPRVAGQTQASKADVLNVENRRHGRHRGYRDDDIDGGDILAGVLILGGIAAIAGIAGSGKNREQSRPAPEPYQEEAGYQAPAREDYRGGGMGQAVDKCVAEVEAGRGPVDSVDRASRSGEGWYVAGELDGGTPYACWIDGAGRVTDVEAGDYRASYEASEGDGAASAILQKQAVEAERGDDGGYALAQAGE